MTTPRSFFFVSPFFVSKRIRTAHVRYASTPYSGRASRQLSTFALDRPGWTQGKEEELP